MEIISRFRSEAVIVPAEFITDYMVQANGDYVKVYLWLLKNGSADIETIAEQLELTEGDVRRAVRYWQEKSVLTKEETETGKAGAEKTGTDRKKSARAAACRAEGSDTLRDRYRGAESAEILERLALDQEYHELIIIVQKYLSRILREPEVQVFAYLYDGLHLPAEVIDYLVAYSVEHEHANIRYIEALGRDWAAAGVTDVRSAKDRVKQFGSPKKTRGGRLQAGKTAETGREAKAPRTDYNSIVAQELAESMVD